MKKITMSMIVAASLLSAATFAAGSAPVLNQISFQAIGQAWAKTTTAKVVIGINATVTNNDVGKVRDSILQKLNNIAPAKWHIVQFTRSQDQSGLEQLTVRAQARLPNENLNKIRENVKAQSQTGEKLSVLAMDFSPNLQQMQDAAAAARADIYQKIKTELKTVNSVYSKQKYSVYRINFNPMHAVFKTALFKMPTPDRGGVMPVANRVVLTANVVLASEYDD